MIHYFKKPCKCGRRVYRSPMNSKVKLCDGCDNWPQNCRCDPPKQDTEDDYISRLREAHNRLRERGLIK